MKILGAIIGFLLLIGLALFSISAFILASEIERIERMEDENDR